MRELKKHIFFPDEEIDEDVEEKEELIECGEDLDFPRIWNYFKEFFRLKNEKNKKKKDEAVTNNKKYLNREEAINIALLDKNLKKYMYEEGISKGFNYGLIELNDFYTTLVIYNNSLYWYVKVLNGKYGFKDNYQNKKGIFNEYSNIRCLVDSKTGKFIYIDESFNTRNIRMITDDEYLKILYKF